MAVVLVPAAAQRLPLHEEEVPGAGVQLVEGARVDRFLDLLRKRIWEPVLRQMINLDKLTAFRTSSIFLMRAWMSARLALKFSRV